MNRRRYLVIARVGDKSLHKNWIAGEHREFDLFLSYYGKTADKYRGDAEIYNEISGPKWPILKQCVEENREVVESYDAVWLPDDDILVDTAQINRMFKLFSGLELDLGQPALTSDSYMSHVFLMQEPGVLARYTDFVEVMVPIISRKALLTLAPTFADSGTGWGLDYLWPALLEFRNVGVLDATPVTHTRPIGGELYKNNPNIDRYQDRKKIQETLAKMGVTLQKPRIFKRILMRNNNSVRAQKLEGLLCRLKHKLRYKMVARYKEPA